jgi:hypothetical protein
VATAFATARAPFTRGTGGKPCRGKIQNGMATSSGPSNGSPVLDPDLTLDRSPPHAPLRSSLEELLHHFVVRYVSCVILKAYPIFFAACSTRTGWVNRPVAGTKWAAVHPTPPSKDLMKRAAKTNKHWNQCGRAPSPIRQRYAFPLWPVLLKYSASTVLAISSIASVLTRATTAPPNPPPVSRAP